MFALIFAILLSTSLAVIEEGGGEGEEGDERGRGGAEYCGAVVGAR